MAHNLKVIVDDETHAALTRLAKRDERDVSKVVRLAIRQYLDREGSK